MLAGDLYVHICFISATCLLSDYLLQDAHKYSDVIDSDCVFSINFHTILFIRAIPILLKSSSINNRVALFLLIRLPCNGT